MPVPYEIHGTFPPRPLFITCKASYTTTTADGSYVVNVPNSKGNYTAVIIKRAGSGFTGPQGEYYTEFPRIEQLKVMYEK